jgi:inositol-1,4,5-trisphosphate 5-phosphatase
LKNPSEYSNNRRNALLYVLKKFNQEEMHSNHLFMFGDFNFRLDLRSFVKKLTRQSTESIIELEDEFSGRKSAEGESSSDSEPSNPVELSNVSETVAAPCPVGGPSAVVSQAAAALPEEDEVMVEEEVSAAEQLLKQQQQLIWRRKSSVVEYRRGSFNVLRIGKKRFEFSDPQQLIDNWHEYKDDDRELVNYRDLRELPITFAPTYPWSEDCGRPNTFMNTRGPAWCDRVLMNEHALEEVDTASAVYSSFGMDTCTGDHKPVLLALSFKGTALGNGGSGGGGEKS